MNLQKQATKLQAERKALGYTQKSLAAFLGCSKSAVIAWENAQNPIPDWVWKMLRQQPSIMPMFSIDEFATMQKKAEAQGQTLQQWVESIIKSDSSAFKSRALHRDDQKPKDTTEADSSAGVSCAAAVRRASLVRKDATAQCLDKVRQRLGITF